jgi:dTDP-4-dehydrorhamnose reductase
VMRILVTGVTGQVGGALVERLQSLGSIVAADRTMLDLAKPEQIAAALDRIAADLIINPAAYTASIAPRTNGISRSGSTAKLPAR